MMSTNNVVLRSESIVFTLVPNGVTADGQNLKLSVFVSPRLIPGTDDTNTLRDFFHWANWPTTLRSLGFAVTFAAGSHGVTQPATLVTTPLSSSLWREIFPETTFVKAYAFDQYSGINIYSYPTANLLSFIQNQYLAVASTSPTAFPSLKDLGANGFGRIGFYLPSPLEYRITPYALPISQAQITSEIHMTFLDKTRNSTLGRGAVQSQSSGYKGDSLISETLNSYLNSVAYSNPTAPLDFAQVNMFFRALKPIQYISDNTPSDPDHGDLSVPIIDFHKEVSALSQYTGTTDNAGLMRQLGLIFDITVPIPTNSSFPKTGTVQLSVTFPPTAPTVLTPMTAYMVDSAKPTIFVAQVKVSSVPDIGNFSNSSGLANGIGMLLLGNSNYMRFQIDLDAASLKALRFAILLLRELYGPNTTVNSPQTLSLPSLQSGGLSIARIDRAYLLANILFNAQNNNTSLGTNSTTLYADDLVRGYRVDVYQESIKKWLSLSYRYGNYKLNGATLDVPWNPEEPEEGWVSLGATQNVNPPQPVETLNVHETLIRWKGWSLCAPRPSSIRRISQDNAANTEAIDNYNPDQALTESNNSDDWKNNNPPINIPLSVTFQFAPGTLPTLRFGQTYVMRARAVDITGNSLSVDDPTIADVAGSHSWLTEKITYGRFEPVESPLVVLREALNPAFPAYVNGNPLAGAPAMSPYSPGETLDHLVMRSGGGKAQTPAVTYNSNLNTLVPGLSSAGRGFLPQSDRNIAPPRTTEHMAELHGMFDDPTTGKFSPAGLVHYSDIVARDQWNFDHYQTALPNCESLNYPAMLGNLVPTAQANPNDFVVHYLPDPMAYGATLRFFDPDGVEVTQPKQFPFYPSASTAWPNLQLFQLTLQEDPNNKFTVSPGATELVVTLPRGTYVDVLLSSYVNPALSTTQLTQLWGILGWAQNYKLGNSGLANLARQGQFWMITPYRKLRLVHAVQQPAGPPGVPKFTPPNLLNVSRQGGATYATLFGNILYHGASTARLDILAAWEEPVDDPGTDPYNPLPVRDGQPWDKNGVCTTSPPPSSPHTLCPSGSDTPPSPPISGGGVHQSQHVVNFTDLDSGFVPSETSALSFSGDKHEFGDTKRRLVRYTVAATTSHLEYLPDQVWKNQQGQPILDANGLPGAIVRYANDDELTDPSDNTSWVTVLDIPSSARPDKPKILYVVPTFGWLRQGGAEWPNPNSASTLESQRFGGGLRVYMERPWYSSGFGEQLGVVLWTGGSPGNLTPPDYLKPLVTQWGMDPIWSSNPVSLLGLKDFVGGVKSYQVQLAERPNDQVLVVPYDVAFDSHRNLWYADIQIASPSYYPFIRLALVRYQPNTTPSTPDIHISPVVLADFAQLTPDRTVTVLTTSNQKTLQVTVAGVFPAEGTQSLPNTIYVYVQTPILGVSDPDSPDGIGPLGWSTAPNSAVQLLAQSGNTGTVYTGPITLKEARGTTPYRLLIAEYEYPGGDPDQVVPPPSDSNDPLVPPPVPPTTEYYGVFSRLVYAETIPL